MVDKKNEKNKLSFPLKLPESFKLPKDKRGSTFGDMNLDDHVTQADPKKNDRECHLKTPSDFDPKRAEEFFKKLADGELGKVREETSRKKPADKIPDKAKPNEGNKPPESPPSDIIPPKPKINLQHPDHLRFFSVGVLALSVLYIYLASTNDFQAEYYTQEITAIFAFGGLPIGLIGFIRAFFLPLPTTKNAVEKPVDPSLCPITNKVIRDKNGKKIPFPFARIKYPSTPQKDCRYSFCDALSQQMFAIQRTGMLEELRQTAFELSPEKRTVLIDKIFDEKSISILIHIETVLHNTRSEYAFDVVQGLHLMEQLDREILRAVFHLYNYGYIEDEKYRYFVGAILASDGAGTIKNYDLVSKSIMGAEAGGMPVDQLHTAPSVAFWLIEHNLAWRHREARSAVMSFVDDLKLDQPNNLIIQEVYNKMHHGGGWMSSLDIAGSLLFDPEKNDKYTLSLGSFDDGTPLKFVEDGSLMTIGGAGTGKTQSLVLPNLLNWAGSAIVLDVKPELYENSAGYRAKNFGKVYKLNFTQHDIATDRFNPFDYLSEEPEKLFSDAFFITQLIAPPYAEGGSDEFWEGGGRNLLQASLIGLVMERIQAKKDKEFDPDIEIPSLSIGAVLFLLADPDQFKQIIYQMETSESAQCRLLAKKVTNHLIKGSDKTSHYLSSFLVTLDLKMQELFNPKLDYLTSTCDWTPDQLRQENATLYILLEASGISQYATMLRLILGIHMREYLDQSELEAKKYSPILLMFDEMPHLGYMEVIEGAIDRGRSKGIKLWGFAQRFGQLKNHFKDAEGLLTNCRVQTYLSPSTEDGLAQVVSDKLGTRTDLASGQQRPLVEPAELSSPRFKDKVIVTGSGSLSVQPNKNMAYQDKELVRRMSIPPPE